jgi:hypothetical protein
MIKTATVNWSELFESIIRRLDYVFADGRSCCRCLIAWRAEFLHLIQGALPIFLFLGGALAIYVGFDEIQEKIREERQRQDEELEKAKEEIESAKAEAERYKEELNKLKEPKI